MFKRLSFIIVIILSFSISFSILADDPPTFTSSPIVLGFDPGDINIDLADYTQGTALITFTSDNLPEVFTLNESILTGNLALNSSLNFDLAATNSVGTATTKVYLIDKELDTDTDEVPDYIELQNGTNISNPYDFQDTDKDGVPDYVEQIEETDPEIPTSFTDDNDNGIPDYTEQPVDSVTFNTPITIFETDRSYDKTDLTIDGTTVTINGTHSFNSITLQNGAVLTHTPTTIFQEYKLELYVNKTVNIDTSSSIDVSYRGYPENRTLGNITWNNEIAGGSYGGYGGKYNSNRCEVYGDFKNPNELGSGASSRDNGGSGGGSYPFTAENLVLDGQIRANGQNSVSGSNASGGSGGGIKVSVDSISGNGSIASNGGKGGTSIFRWRRRRPYSCLL